MVQDLKTYPVTPGLTCENPREGHPARTPRAGGTGKDTGVGHASMDGIRKSHNAYKRDLIEEHVRECDHVLDVGSGFGGDLQKYRARACRFAMCDPCPEALEEAKTRAKKMRIPVDAWYVGDITSTPKRRYDVVAFFFSLHFIFASRELFFKSTRAIRERVKKGGKLIGIIPDSEMINWRTPFKDELGNWFKMRHAHADGGFGEKLFVELVDTPFYADGPRSEPIAFKDVLITQLEDLGLRLVSWENLRGAEISELYARFVFKG